MSVVELKQTFNPKRAQYSLHIGADKTVHGIFYCQAKLQTAQFRHGTTSQYHDFQR